MSANFAVACDGFLCRRLVISHARAQAAAQIGLDKVSRVADADIEAKAAAPLAEVEQPYTLGHGLILHDLGEVIDWIAAHKTQIEAVVSIIIMIAAAF